MASKQPNSILILHVVSGKRLLTPEYPQPPAKRPKKSLIICSFNLACERKLDLKEIKEGFFQLPELNNAGLSGSIVYMRSPCTQLLTWLDNNISSKPCYIWGPPGVGKSTTVWLWCCRQAAQETVCWVHFGKTVKSSYCLLAQGHISGPFDFDDTWNLDLSEIHAKILVFDGITRKNITKIRDAWSKKCKLVLVSSVGTILGSEVQPEKMEMTSWTEQEYIMALKCDEFFNSVEHALPPGRTRLERLKNKYFYGGGSARLMFNAEPVVKGWIEEAINRNDVSLNELMQRLGAGCQAKRSINTLIAHYPQEKKTLVSHYVTRRLAETREFEFLREAANHTISENPTVDGWLFEADFLLSISCAYNHNSTVSLTSEDGVQLSWGVASYTTFDTETDIDLERVCSQYPSWIIPKRWNQGCYDAVVLWEPGHVTFVQVTRAKRHSLKLAYPVNFLDQVGKAQKITRVEVAFILDSSKVNIKKFKIQHPIGSWRGYRKAVKIGAAAATLDELIAIEKSLQQKLGNIKGIKTDIPLAGVRELPGEFNLEAAQAETLKARLKETQLKLLLQRKVVNTLMEELQEVSSRPPIREENQARYLEELKVQKEEELKLIKRDRARERILNEIKEIEDDLELLEKERKMEEKDCEFAEEVAKELENTEAYCFLFCFDRHK